MQEGSAPAKRPSALTIDRAAFLLLRVKRAFKKKRQQRKEKHAAAVAASAAVRRVPPPLLRSRTLPAIVAPPLSILHAQIDPSHAAEVTQSQQLCRGISSHRVSCVSAALPRITCISDEANDAGEGRRKSAFSHLGVSPRSSFALEQPDACTIRVGSASPRGSFSSGGTSSSRFPDDASRRLSWERDSSSSLPRSGSIDSVVEASAVRVRRSEPSAGITLQIPRPERALSLASPAVGRRAKPHRALAELHYGALVEGCAGELPSLSACAPPARPRARDIDTHTDNRTQIDIHQQALFAAVEHGYLDKARNILDSTDVDVNSINTDGLSPLDVAVLTGNRPLATMLMEFGAKDGGQFKTPEALGAHLRKLCREAESRLREVGGTREPLPPTTTGCAGAASERDKQLQHWDRRHRTLKRLTSGWSSVRTAGSLPPPGVEVCGPHAVCVRVPALRDARHANSPILTKYKVEWSSRSDFSNVCGTREVSACTLSGTGAGRVLISGLTRGRRYYFRVAAGNLRGWSDPTVSLPRSVVPSSWRDVSSPVSRGETGKTDEQLDAVATACANARRTPGGAGAAALTAGGVAAARARKNTIRQLFTGSKFHKNLRRGVYLACVVYQEERVLVTSEEFIPVVEVDETGPAALGSELHWLMKVSCAWPDVKSLRTDLQKHPSPSLHFRRRLLAAVAHMQAALSLMDLGQVYPTPLRDAAGTLVISLVSAARAGKPPALNSRWVALHKLRRRGLGDDNTIADLLLGSLHDQIRYHQVSRAALPRGLYVGYLKLQASVDEVRVVVSANAPNVPPHTRLRDNPHVSAEEWQYLKSQSGRTDDNKSVSNMSVSSEQPSECQEMFLQQVSAGAKRLFRDMELPADSTKDHRFYDLEVVELSGDVSFVMLCPPPGRACCVPGQREMLLQRAGLLSLPVQAFEMIHLQTYRPHLLAKFCRLSCLLELDVALAAHSHREAFSCDELNTAKERLTKLEDLQNDLNTVWKTERWLMDLIGFARDKSGPAGVLLEHILDKSSTTDGEKDVNLKIDLLQIPARDGKINKTSPGRGSWPGPGGSGPTTLHPEFSKSEQQLSVAPRQPSASTLNLSSNYLNESQFKRKGSGDSQMTQSSNYMSGGSQFDIKSSGSSLNGRLPPSRSEDTLVLHNDAKPQPRPHSISASLPSASPLLSRGLGATSMVSVRGNESAQSLSSDSDCHSCPKLRVTASESMASLNAEDAKKLPESKEDNQENEEENREQSEGGILQVFAAYETGLAAGTSLKLHVTARTTAREVIELVVKQLNMAALLRARRGPLYPPHRLPDFCLVAVIGARERCLRDDFRPLQLQNPWRRGRLYVRLKHDVLAALTHSANQPAYI